MKTSVISKDCRARSLANPDDPEAFEVRAVVFDGPEDYHRRIDLPELALDVHSIRVMRGAGPIGYPGAAEVVNMRSPWQQIQHARSDSLILGQFWKAARNSIVLR